MSPLPPQDPIDWSDPEHPRSQRYGDVFASRAGALQQAEKVFLRGNGLPARWRGRDRFVILETGFGLGNNFLASWDAWQRDPARPRQLFFLSLDAHPVSAADLQRAHAHSPLAALAQAVVAQWPPRTPGWHRLDLAGGAVRLLLAFGDVQAVLPQWQAEVDAFFLDGFAPRLNPAMWSAEALAPLARLAAPGATAATWSAARSVRDALQSAGFACERVPGFGGKAQMTVARFVPAARPAPAGRRALAPAAREAVVLGAGIAGAASARLLRDAGLDVRVLDPLGAAQAASGNPAGLYHGTVHADDGPHARWNRSAALRCAQWQRRAGRLPQGLLRLAGPDAQAPGAAAPDPDYAQWLDTAAASQAAGRPLTQPAWLYPGGGALAPRAWVQELLAGLPVERQAVAGLRALAGGRWQLLDAQGQALAETGLLVLAAGHQLPALLAGLQAPLPLRAQRGALSAWSAQAHALQRPLASGGYVLQQGGQLLAGATASFEDPADARASALRDEDAAHNQAVAERLLGLAPGQLPPPDGGRVAWRLLAADKLPLVGGLIDPSLPPPARATQAAHWPRRPGLLVLGAMASRGLSWAPLAAELGVALALGEPAPVERSLLDAVDPARFAVREIRKR